MKKTAYIFIALLMLGFSIDCRVFGTAGVELPPVKTFTLANGLSVFYVKDDLPQLTLVVSVGFGKLYETKEQAGVADLVAKSLSLAGSKNYPGVALYEKVDALGGKLSIAASWENTVISIKVLRRFASEAFAIVNDLLTNPNFNASHVAAAQAMLAEDIKRKFDDPANIAFEKAREIIFNGNGYGAVVTADKIKAYNLDTVTKTWAAYFTAKNSSAGIATAVDFEEIRKLSAIFSQWQPGQKKIYQSDYASIKSSLAKHKNKIYLYPKDIPQATIVVGTVGPDIKHTDNYSLEVMNYILGGGSFNSRLMQEIRVKRGLAYSVGSVLRARKSTGVFLSYAQVKNEQVQVALPLITDNCNLMAKEKISQSDITWAKQAINNSFIFMFDTPMQIIGNYIDIAYNDLPADYYSSYVMHIEKVTAEAIMQASSDLFNQGLITVVVGKNSLAHQLQKLGTVEIIQ